MPPLIIAAIIAAGAGIASAAAQGVASGNAAAKQKDAAQASLDLQREMWQTQRADQAPWLEAGKTSLADLLRLKNDPSAIANSPAFQFRLAEGQKALERSAAARGGLNSGGFMKGMARYSQGLASDEYNNQWDRLAGLAGVGQSSAQNLGAMGADYANRATNTFGDIGNAQAAGSVGIGNAINSGLGTLGGIALGLGSRYSPPQPYQPIPTQNRIQTTTPAYGGY